MAPTSTLATHCLGYTPIPVALLASDEVPAVDLYRKDPETGRLRLYRAADVPMQPDDMARLAQQNIHWLYADQVNPAGLQVFIRRKLDDLISDESLSIRDRFVRLNQMVHGLLSSAFESNDTDELVRAATHTSALAVRLLCQDELAAGDLVSLLYHDYQTVTHSLNVSILLTTLARRMQLASGDELTSLAAAGVLHDVGKLSVSEQILHKPDRLARREERVSQKHPELGFRRLATRIDLSFGQLMVVYQHHERIDGSGYPVRSVGREIHPWAQACAVVNVFESLVSHRPYRQRYPLLEAISLMDHHLARGLDQEMYQCWKHLVLKK